MAELRVEVLGKVRASLGGREVELGSPLCTSLFALLALGGNEPVARADLIDGLWGDEPPHAADASLYTYVSLLRRSMSGHDDLLQRARPGYVLRVDGGPDSSAFEAGIKRAEHLRTAGDVDGAVGEWDAALARWHGTPLDGLPGPGCALHRERLNVLRLTAVADRAEAMLALGRHAELVNELAGPVEEEPLWERLRWLWMLTLYRCGRRGDALKSYEDIRARIAEEAGLDPGAELVRLAQQITAEDVALDRSSVAEPADEVTVRPALLPDELPAFVGREKEISRLLAVCDTPSRTVVISAIDGAAGIGKTTLAVHVGHRLAERFADGQLHVNLNGFDPVRSPMSSGEALTRLLRALGIAASAIPGSVEEKAALYRSTLAERRMLVLLDNAVSSDQVRALLPGSPGSLVLVTSRSRLGGLVVRDGAQRVTLGVFGESESLDLLALAIGRDRVDGEPHAASELASLCGHLPLALRIVGERIASMPTQSLAAAVTELSDAPRRLDFLATGDDEWTAVRTALSWTYGALKPPAARLFRLLGLHAGLDFSVDAASELIGEPSRVTRQLLDVLHGLHLVEQSRRDRFQFHDLVRLCAAERSQDEPENERAACVARQHNWYLRMAHAANFKLTPARYDWNLAWLKGPPSEFGSYDEALGWLETERANLVAVVHQAEGMGEDLVAMRLPIGLNQLFALGKQWDEWEATMKVAVAAAQRIGNREFETKALNRLAICNFDRGDLAEGLEPARKALEIDIQIERDAQSGQCRQLCNIGAACTRLDRLDDAVEALLKALAIAEKIDERFAIGLASCNIAAAYIRLGQTDEALRHAERGVEVFGELDGKFDEAYGWTVLGEVHTARGDHRLAIDAYRSALVLRRSVADPFGEALALCGMAESLRGMGDMTASRSAALNAYVILDRLGAREVERARALLAADDRPGVDRLSDTGRR